MELKSNELRIGNWIRTTTDEQVYDVLCDCINTHEHECLLYDMIAPIPLTEEWLVRFGFKFDKNTGLYHKSDFDIGFVKDGYIEFYLAEYGSWFRCLEFVHQLQNLYFALTGEELELSPK